MKAIFRPKLSEEEKLISKREKALRAMSSYMNGVTKSIPVADKVTLNAAIKDGHEKTIQAFKRYYAPSLFRLTLKTNEELRTNLGAKYGTENVNQVLKRPELKPRERDIQAFLKNNPSASPAAKIALLLSFGTIERDQLFTIQSNNELSKRFNNLERNRERLYKQFPNLNFSQGNLAFVTHGSTLPVNRVMTATVRREDAHNRSKSKMFANSSIITTGATDRARKAYEELVKRGHVSPGMSVEEALRSFSKAVRLNQLEKKKEFSKYVNKNTGNIFINSGGDRIKIGSVRNTSNKMRKTILETKDIKELLSYYKALRNNNARKPELFLDLLETSRLNPFTKKRNELLRIKSLKNSNMKITLNTFARKLMSGVDSGNISDVNFQAYIKNIMEYPNHVVARIRENKRSRGNAMEVSTVPTNKDVMRILMANGSTKIQDLIKKSNNQLSATSANPSVFTTIMKEGNTATSRLKQRDDDPGARLRNYMIQAKQSLMKANAGEIGADKSNAYRNQLMSRITVDLIKFVKNNPDVNIIPILTFTNGLKKRKNGAFKSNLSNLKSYIGSAEKLKKLEAKKARNLQQFTNKKARYKQEYDERVVILRNKANREKQAATKVLNNQKRNYRQKMSALITGNALPEDIQRLATEMVSETAKATNAHEQSLASISSKLKSNLEGEKSTFNSKVLLNDNQYARVSKENAESENKIRADMDGLRNKVQASYDTTTAALKNKASRKLGNKVNRGNNSLTNNANSTNNNSRPSSSASISNMGNSGPSPPLLSTMKPPPPTLKPPPLPPSTMKPPSLVPPGLVPSPPMPPPPMPPTLPPLPPPPMPPPSPQRLSPMPPGGLAATSDSRSALLSAIQGAGGKGGLKPVAQSNIRNRSGALGKSAKGGDLMAQLQARMAARRKGIGNNNNNNS